ncbi:MAG TPA: ATP-binding protein, partial [Bacteroidales bacterium]|nr:ATP-binding protein [Bacteroidales bacterium]
TEDDNGFLWISTLHGLTRLDPNTCKTFNFVNSNGIPSDQFVPRVVYRNSKKQLFFGSLHGLIQFNPDNLKFNTKAPKIIITGFHLHYTPSERTNNRNQLIPPGKKIKLKYSQNAISFRYVALNMIHPSHNQYKYRLKGLETEWNYAGTKREATYTNLDPGTYVFEVTGSNNDGVWNKQSDSVILKIYPPWWGTWYARLSAIIILIAVIIGVVRLRTLTLLKQRRKLSGMIEEKTLELEEMNEELQQQTYEVETKNRLLVDEQQRIEKQSAELVHKNMELEDMNAINEKIFTIIAHDLRSPFNALLGLSGLLSANHEQYDALKRGKLISQLQQSLNTLYQTTDNLLNWSSRHISDNMLHPEVFNLTEIVTRNIEFVKSIAAHKSISLEFSNNEIFLVKADPNMIDAVIRNLLSNAVKFSDSNSKIKISIQKNGSQIECAVKDFGSGMSKEVLKNLFTGSQNIRKNGTSGEKGSGLGLMICYDFIHMNNGKIWAESEEGKGSTFYFSLPEGNT